MLHDPQACTGNLHGLASNWFVPSEASGLLTSQLWAAQNTWGRAGFRNASCANRRPWRTSTVRRQRAAGRASTPCGTMTLLAQFVDRLGILCRSREVTRLGRGHVQRQARAISWGMTREAPARPRTFSTTEQRAVHLAPLATALQAALPVGSTRSAAFDVMVQRVEAFQISTRADYYPGA